MSNKNANSIFSTVLSENIHINLNLGIYNNRNKIELLWAITSLYELIYAGRKMKIYAFPMPIYYLLIHYLDGNFDRFVFTQDTITWNRKIKLKKKKKQ